VSDADRLWQAARSILPEDVGCAVVPIGAGRLLPAEAEVMARAVPRRRAEFASGRLALRRAIAATGTAFPDDRAILPRADRRPDLPPGLSVSLAHAGQLCIALASHRAGVMLGVDIEPVTAIRPERLSETLQPFRFRGSSQDDLLAFSAKEALYKRQFPVTGRLLEFSDVALILLSDGRFRGCVAGVGSMQGRWLEATGYYLAISVGPVNRHTGSVSGRGT
jgi:4'-phosphopantetheinyl transferase EntD